ncbi:MAG: helix-turn-helix transcriptional regulator [Candidatus Marinimicrobia bacterium]|nr:helix-turn-helix transcriptional regulator [Candidatus Neomarinimicrobiota bacterium]
MNKIESIGSIIRFHRKKAGLTQKQLATLAGVGKTAVFDIEKGKKTVRLNTLTTLLSILNIHLIVQSPLMDQYNHDEGNG